MPTTNPTPATIPDADPAALDLLGPPSPEPGLPRYERPDLRRRIGRDLAELLLRRAEHLPTLDRELLRSVFSHGRRTTHLAAMLRARPRAIRRRIRRLVERLTSPAYVFVARSLGDWDLPTRRMAIALYLHGLPMREAAEEAGASLHAVRRLRETIDATVAAGSHGGLRLSARKRRGVSRRAAALKRRRPAWRA